MRVPRYESRVVCWHAAKSAKRNVCEIGIKATCAQQKALHERNPIRVCTPGRQVRKHRLLFVRLFVRQFCRKNTTTHTKQKKMKAGDEREEQRRHEMPFTQHNILHNVPKMTAGLTYKKREGTKGRRTQYALRRYIPKKGSILLKTFCSRLSAQDFLQADNFLFLSFFSQP